MFGIGLPELIVIMGLALIVVGPEKLPDLAKTVARQLLELKKAAGSLKQGLDEEMGDKPWQDFDRDQPSSFDQSLPPGEPPVKPVKQPPFEEVINPAPPQNQSTEDDIDQQSQE